MADFLPSLHTLFICRRNPRDEMRRKIIPWGLPMLVRNGRKEKMYVSNIQNVFVLAGCHFGGGDFDTGLDCAGRRC
jgi:hypothetical protein